MLKILFNLLKFFLITIALLIVVALILRIILFKGPVLTPSALPTTPIIDMHVHTAGLGHGNSGSFISDELKKGYKFDYYLKAFGVTAKSLKAEGDQLAIQQLAKMVDESKHVKGAVVLAMDGVMHNQGENKGKIDKEKTQVYIPGSYVAEETAKYPTLHYGASINPYRRDALNRLEQAKEHGAVLIKWIPNIQHIDPSDLTLTPFYAKMKELGLPLLSHTGQERAFGSAIDDYGDPKRLKLPLAMGVTVIAAHIATTGESDGESNYERALPMLSGYPNFYSEISSLTQINKLGYLNNAISNPKIKDKLLYGSDFPLTNMVLVSPYYFPLNLTFKQMYNLSNISNPLDRDVALKQALGVPTEVFARSAELLNIK